jgi:hypothetical protein
MVNKNYTKVIPLIDLPLQNYYFDNDFIAVNPYTRKTFGNLYYFDNTDINNPRFVYVGIFAHQDFIIDRY